MGGSLVPEAWLGDGDRTPDADPGWSEATWTSAAPGAHGLVRPRVSALLEQVVEHRLALVVAPAGAGKTTAVDHWSSGRSSVTVWRRAPLLVGPPGTLTAGLRRAVRDAHGTAGRSTQPLVVVLDDAHVLAPRAQEELSDLLQTVPDHIAVLLLSRAPLALDLARAELPRPVHVGAGDLRLLPHELQQVYTATSGAPLSASSAVDLSALTGGWPAGVRLLAGAVGRSGRGVPQALSGAGGTPWAADYLERHVLAGLSDQDRDLLVRTSVLPLLTEQACDTLLRIATGSSLRVLARAGVLVRVPGAMPAYRCPDVLRRHLLHELAARLGPDGLGTQQARADALVEEVPPPDPASAERVLRLLRRGDRRAARELLQGQDGAEPSAPVRLAVAALDAVLDREPAAVLAVADTQQALHEDGRRDLARLAAGLAATLDGAEGFALQLADATTGRDAVLLRGVVALSQLRDGRADPGLVEQVAQDARACGDIDVEVWARVLHALVAASAQLPDAEEAAVTAEALARRADLPAASAVACAALALARPGRGAADLLALARSESALSGLDCLPWTWLAPPASPVTTRPSGARPSGVAVGCFGAFRLSVDGVPVDTTSVRPRVRTLLRLLALHADEPVHRDRLVDTLWGELEPCAGMHNLQVAVSSLRAVLEPHVPGRDSRLLVRQGEAYVLRLGPGGSSDLHDFDAALRRAAGTHDDDEVAAALVDALALYRDDLLLEDGTAEWVSEHRARYRLRAAEAAGTLAEVHLRQGRAAAAAQAAARSVELDRYRDSSWRLLLRACTEAGDPARAELARRTYRTVLADLGLPHVQLEVPHQPTGSAADQPRPKNSTSPRATGTPGRTP
ncbi:MAG: transcriptional regulator, family [Frankiales bacterium]|nr:transcriptional regulator, family [Frankiales bacterium]